MTEKQVTLDSLREDTIFVDTATTLSELDDDIEAFVDKLSLWVDFLTLEGDDLLLSTRALARRKLINR